MKEKSKIFHGLLMTWLLLAWLPTSLAEIKNENFVPNGSFEVSTDGKTPDQWSMTGDGGTAGQDTKQSKVGEAGLRLDLKSGSGEKRSSGVRSEQFKMVGGKLYLLTFNYLAKGFKTDANKYLGANASGRIIFFNAEKKQVDSRVFGLPYRNTKGWEQAAMCVNPPEKAVMAEIYLALSTSKPSVLPTVWFDDLRLREWIPGKDVVRTFNYGVGHAYPAGELVVDHSLNPEYDYQVIKCDPNKQKKGLAAAFPDPELLPGEYTVIFRLKVDDNTVDAPVCLLSSTSQGLTGTMNTRTVTAKEFAKPNHYQEFNYDFIIPCPGYTQHCVNWEGKVGCQIDYLTLIQRKFYSPEDFKLLWPEN